MKKKIIIFLLLALFIIDMLLVISNNASQIDTNVHNALFHHNLVSLMKIITFFGSTLCVVIMFLIIIFILYRKGKKQECIDITLIVVITTLINNIVKILVGRERPEYILVVENTNSFPSGHTMISVALYGYLTYIIFKSTLNKKIKIILSSILILLIIGVAISRIILGAHYFTDVIGGFLLSIIIILIYNLITKRKRHVL